jgi:DNA-binding NtrC family response regulator
MALPWPGNVRQLENFIEQAIVLAQGDSLNEHDLLLDSSPFPESGAQSSLQLDAGLPLREVERRYILHTLREVGFNRTRAAARLGISLRCLQYKLKHYIDEPGDIERSVNRFAGVQRMLRG